MRSSRPAMVLALFLAALVPTTAVPQTSQPSQAATTALTNKDVVEMLQAGLTPEIVAAKIESSGCNFDTSPDALKKLKAESVPDAVILAMVQAPVVSRVEATPERALREAQITFMSAKEIPLLSSPGVLPPVGEIKCGDRISVLEEKDPWDKVRTPDGRDAYISSYF